MQAVLGQSAELARLRATVDDALGRMLPDPGEPPHRLHAAMRYALLAPGKRVRPVLTLLCAEHLGGDPAVALAPACAVEMVHAASLILDDLPCMDDSDSRRGQPSTHVRYGEDVAVLTAVALLNQAYATIARAPGLGAEARLEMTQALSDAVGLEGLVAGQESDLRRDESLSPDRLGDIHHRKTGVLFMAALELGGLAAGAAPVTLEALRRFAGELGLAFQALDDISDGEEDGGDAAAAPNVLSLLGETGARSEAERRIAAAKSALREAGPALAPLALYVDLVLAAA